ncbi:origin of replication complex subunit 4 [Pseudoscourfieldia marina]
MAPTAEQPATQLFGLLRACVEQGHNHSVLVVGPKGAGKTKAVEHAVAQTAAACGASKMRVVRLSGLLHGGAEGTALREIANQLGADCDEEACEEATAAGGDGARVLGALLRHEYANKRTSIFVLDDFHLFATKSRQGLLYNLLDAMQSDQACLAVVGVTPRHDVVESMEKRVRSRFSHRLVAVGANDTEVVPADQLHAATDAISEALALPLVLPRDHGAGASTSTSSSPPPPSAADWRAFAASWNDALANALGSPRLKAALVRAYEDGLTPRVLSTACHGTLANVQARATAADSAGSPTTIRAEDIAVGLAVSGGAFGREASVAESSIAELAVLVVLFRLESRALLSATQQANDAAIGGAGGALAKNAGTGTSNFLAICQEYAALCAAAGGADSFSRRTLSRAVASLCHRELVGPSRVSHGGGVSLWSGAHKSLLGDVYVPLRVMVSRLELENGVRAHARAPASLLRWLKET